MKIKIIVIYFLAQALCTYPMGLLHYMGLSDPGRATIIARQPSPQNFRQLAQELLASNADLNAPNPNFYGESPLIRLSYHEECLDVIEELLKKGANPNVLFLSDRLPLDNAIRAKAVPIVEILLRYHANPNQPMMVFPQVIRPLLCMPWDESSILKTKEIIQLLLHYQCNIDGTNNDHDTALHELAFVSDIRPMSKEIRKYFTGILLYYGANTKLKNVYISTAAERARKYGLPEFAELIERCHNPLVKNLTRLLSYIGTRGKGYSPFPPDIAFVIAQWRYCNTGT